MVIGADSTVEEDGLAINVGKNYFGAVDPALVQDDDKYDYCEDDDDEMWVERTLDGQARPARITARMTSPGVFQGEMTDQIGLHVFPLTDGCARLVFLNIIVLQSF
jgi:hypothetical protein